MEMYLIVSGAVANALLLLAVFAYLAGWLTFTYALDQLDDDETNEPYCRTCSGSGLVCTGGSQIMGSCPDCTKPQNFGGMPELDEHGSPLTDAQKRARNIVAGFNKRT